MVLLNVNKKCSCSVFSCYPVHKDIFHHFAQSVHYYHYIDAGSSPKVTADGKINYEIDRNVRPSLIWY